MGKMNKYRDRINRWINDIQGKITYRSHFKECQRPESVRVVD